MRNELYQRELSWVALFSMAMHVFSGIFGSFIKVLIFIFLPISLLESVILGRMNATTIALQAFTQAADPNTVNVENLVGLLSRMLTQEFLLFAVTLFLQPVGVIAIAKMTKQYVDGERVEVSKAIGEALNHMPAIIITGIIFGALVLLGSFVIVPGIYFGIAWGLYYFCIAFEGKSGWEALRGSKALVQGKWLKTCGYFFLLSCVSVVWNSVFDLICSFFPEGMAVDILYQFLCYISVGFIAVGKCLLYLNRKAVAEGTCIFDTGFVRDYGGEDIPAEPVEGTVDGIDEGKTEEIGLLEEKTEENENK